MSDTPLVSVIISAYNVERYNEEAVRSILNQDYKNIEVLIADDASTDGTRMLIDGLDDSRIRCFHNEKNAGYLATWNKLLPLARGRYITFQDGDDVSHPQRISKLVAFLEAHPEVGLCGSNYVRFFKPWGLFAQSNFPLLQADIEKEIEKGQIPFAGTRVIIRREVYEKVGGFREFFHGLTWEDYDWILRIMENFPVANIPDVLYEYRYFRRSTSKQSFESSIEKLYVDKIGFFLVRQRKESGADALQNNRPEEIENFVSAFRKQEASAGAHTLRYRRVLSNVIANKDFGTAWALWWKRLRHYPVEVKSITDAFTILSAFARTVIKSLVFRLQGKSRDSIVNF